MTRVTRYVVGELLKVFLAALAAMTVLMMVAGLAQEAISKGLGPVPVLRLIPYAVPNALRFAVPGTILFAACSVFGRMSAANEIVAVKSLGISPLRVLNPAFVLAFVVSLGAVWLNDLAVSWGREGMRRVILHSVEQIAYGTLRTHGSYSCDAFSISVRRVEDRRLVQPYICLHGRNGSPATVITAAEAELRLKPEQSALTVSLTDGQLSVDGKVTATFPDTIDHDIPLGDAIRDGASTDSPSNLPMWRIQPETEAQREAIRRQREKLASDAACQLATGDLAAFQGESWSQGLSQLESAEHRLHRLHTEPWRRWANGFSCLFFVLVGAPLAVRLRNADLWSSFALCFLPILLVYYPLLAFGVDRAKGGDLPPWTVWLGNVILAVIGLVLLRTVQRR